MNHMKQIAKMLGVGLGERFKTRSGENKINDKIFMLTETGMKTDDGSWANGILCDLLTGLFDVVKLPWKPKDGEKVWYWGIDTGSPAWDYFRSNDLQFLSMYRLGKLYRTKAEAEAHMEDKYFWNEIRKELEE